MEYAMDKDRGVYVMSIAAELAHMHPQTLRKYERRGLLSPRRVNSNRLYSENDLARLAHIKELADKGVNIEGIKIIFEMEAKQ